MAASPIRSHATFQRVQRVLVQVVLVLLSLAFLFPFLWLLSTALKPINETMTSPPTWIPSEWQWGNFGRAIRQGYESLHYYPLLVYARNTVVLSLLVVSGTVVSNALVAYSFARLRWPGGISRSASRWRR